jgi:hypothetical protein
MASKKSFRGDMNPVMQFISQPADGPGECQKDGGAASLPAGKAPKGYKPNPLYVETKSRRVQLLVQPSMHERLKARAAKEGKSVNELANSLLESGLREE